MKQRTGELRCKSDLCFTLHSEDKASPRRSDPTCRLGVGEAFDVFPADCPGNIPFGTDVLEDPRGSRSWTLGNLEGLTFLDI